MNFATGQEKYIFIIKKLSSLFLFIFKVGRGEAVTFKEHSVPGAVRRRGKRWRIVGIFQHGWSLIIAALLNHQLLPVKPGRPEAWPRLPGINQAPWAAAVERAG